MWCLFLISVGIGTVIGQNEESLVVNIKQGPVRGYKQPDSNVFAFYGIPYATAPTGRQKFMPPLPPPEWTETLEAVQRHIVCIQPGFPNTQEDCLVANVYVPHTNQTNLPVMVIVHGGGFQSLYGSILHPTALVNSTNMIAVSFNYRLGAHGFLCLGTEEIPGNSGMKDQVALLRWVQDNIAQFGGNPNDVTIEGCSAGSASVDLLSVSPMAKGLFHKIIAGSGSNVATFGVQLDPVENARIYARALNFDRVDDLDALEEFYKTAPYETLLSDIEAITVRPDSMILFGPCVEADLGSERFLDDAPFNILRQQTTTRYPMLYGFTNLDGLLHIDHFDNWKSMMNERFSDFVPADLHFENNEEKEDVAAKIKQFYFGDEDVSESNILSYIEFITDTIFAQPMLRNVRLHSEFGDNPMYIYEYSYWDNNTDYVPHTTERGANHCDQVIAVMDENVTDSTLAYIEMKEIMREIYSNFITLGVPVPEGSSLPAWPPADVQRTPHMSIGSILQLQGSPTQSRADFWDEIYDKYYKAPIPPRSSAFQLIFSPYFVIVMLVINIMK
ncbi:venom carboxylesterase-6-like [Plodia interpunctella]|uniref:venom carboxylesterase-6-like n=1 Tax=Plodia interpunctella TaxID=58824 RepID=UPI002368AD85|nr:venom carboxylesterase-6-like [Plodia interpunctella]